tara:strand:- start:8534 stop:8917 length:384 start_codon:yes stop_codon:yes gene_type:complete
MNAQDIKTLASGEGWSVERTQRDGRVVYGFNALDKDSAPNAAIELAKKLHHLETWTPSNINPPSDFLKAEGWGKFWCYLDSGIQSEKIFNTHTKADSNNGWNDSGVLYWRLLPLAPEELSHQQKLAT